MISTDFASNENWNDAWLSFKLLFQPWRWYHGKESAEVKRQVLSQFQISNFKFQINTFLTGRSALYHLLKGFNLPSGTEIAVQAFTCEAVVLPILALKLKPVYIDIEKNTFSMEPIDLASKITDRTKVIILQHSFGLVPAQREKIIAIIKRNNLVLIEDIAHGAKFSILNFQFPNSYLLMSFGRSKALSSVFGGAIVSNNNVTIQQCSNVSILFMIKLLLYKPLAMLIKSTYDIYLGKILHKILNSSGILSQEITSREKNGQYDPLLDKAYPNALSILLLEQLKKFEQTKANRARITAYYDKNSKLRTMNYGFSPLIRYPLLVDKRSEALQKAANFNIFLGKWYDQVVAPKELDLNRVGYKAGSCPVAEEVCKKIINLPTNITIKDAERIIKILNDVVSN